jgi:hypothetical protein
MSSNFTGWKNELESRASQYEGASDALLDECDRIADEANRPDWAGAALGAGMGSYFPNLGVFYLNGSLLPVPRSTRNYRPFGVRKSDKR